MRGSRKPEYIATLLSLSLFLELSLIFPGGVVTGKVGEALAMLLGFLFGKAAFVFPLLLLSLVVSSRFFFALFFPYLGSLYLLGDNGGFVGGTVSSYIVRTFGILGMAFIFVFSASPFIARLGHFLKNLKNLKKGKPLRESRTSTGGAVKSAGLLKSLWGFLKDVFGLEVVEIPEKEPLALPSRVRDSSVEPEHESQAEAPDVAEKHLPVEFSGKSSEEKQRGLLVINLKTSPDPEVVPPWQEDSGYAHESQEESHAGQIQDAASEKEPAHISSRENLPFHREEDLQEEFKAKESQAESCEQISPRTVSKFDFTEWKLPPVSLLESHSNETVEEEDYSEKIEKTLRSYGVEARVVGLLRGPVVTRYEVVPGEGVKISKIASLSDEIALSLATQRVRIVGPIPGKGVIGIEVPNKKRKFVYLRDILESKEWRETDARLPVALGMDEAGNKVVVDVTRMPHLLIAGVTGSGKSVALHTIIMSLIYRLTPEDLRFILIDPKRVELSLYNSLPHLLSEPVHDPNSAAMALRWLVDEMERRYSELASSLVRDINEYRKLGGNMPYIVAIVDELADLMMVASSQVEDSVARLAQMARAVGIHLVLATQRPSVDVITGVIKANFPTRIAFQVFTKTDSRVILDVQGAEKLLGMGDMLYLPAGAARPRRLQGTYVSVEEIRRVVDFWAKQGKKERIVLFKESERGSRLEELEDELFPEAARVVIEKGYGSVSLLQNKLRVGYARASRLMNMLEERGVVAPYTGDGKPRKVLVGKDFLSKLGA